MHRTLILTAALLGTWLLSHLAWAEETVSLAGAWRFAIDRSDAGETERWFTRNLTESLRLPGAMQEQGFGDLPSGNTKWTAGIGAALLGNPKYAPYRNAEGFKTPFWLTPRRYYVGAAWYQRDIDIPANWAGQRIVLFLERAHWQTTLWLDDTLIGSRDSLGVAHECDLTKSASPGRHHLTLRVDNRVKIPVGNDAHSVSDQTQGNWNGIAGRITLSASAPIFFDDIQVYPDVAAHKAKVVVQLSAPNTRSGSASLRLSARSFNTQADHQPPARQFPLQWQNGSARAEIEYDLGEGTQLWDEFSPALYRLSLDLTSDSGQTLATRTVTFGMRQLSTSGTQFTINNRPIFLRGTLECCIFPLTGYPPTDVDSWKRILRIARAHGLNHIRFHSWCPPEAAFIAADEIGFYFQVECSCWAAFGDGTPLDKWIYEEADRMLKAYGNHPSFLLMVPTNEPGGKNRDRFLGALIKSWAAKDPRRMYTAGSGWPMIPENQYHVTPTPRIQASRELDRAPQTAADYRDFIAKQRVPVVSHEIGQWCVYPNPDERTKYTGAMKAGNLEIFRDFLANAGMLEEAPALVNASGKFQALLYKEEIEAALRTPGMAGYQLLDLHDFPGQGTAPVGVLDAFWDSKGYISADEYRRFSGQTVPLARMTRRTFLNNESFEAQVDIAHYGPADLAAATPAWTLRDSSNRPIARGEFEPRTIPTGRLTTLGKISVPLSAIKKATRLTLEVALRRTDVINTWNIWVYPASIDPAIPQGITIAHTLEEALPKLDAGEKVLLLPGPGRIAGNTLGGFRPIFWNRITFPSQREHTLGIFCNPAHPALADFPTDAHSDWQWWDLQQNCKPMLLTSLPKELTPVVQMIDDWDACRKIGLVIEAAVSRGKLILCSIDLDKNLDDRPVARQLRSSLLQYMATDKFQPSVRLQPAQLQSLIRDPLVMQRLGAKVISCDSADPDYPADSILDGDPRSFWHTPWEGPHALGFPHELTIQFAKPVTLAGLTLLPRQDVHNGFTKDYAIRVSDDGATWREPARGAFDDSPSEKQINFPQPQTCRYLKFIALSPQNPTDRFATLSDLSVIEAK